MQDNLSNNYLSDKYSNSTTQLSTSSNPILTHPTVVTPTKDQNMSLIHYNIQGCRHKLAELEIYLTNAELSPDIIILSEHWLRHDNINFLDTYPNYKLTGYYARDLRDRGGSSILLRNNLHFRVRDDIMQYAEIFSFEIACIEVTLKGNFESNNIVILSIYRTPDSNPQIMLMKFEKILDKLIRESIKRKKKKIIGGDFNINVLLNIETVEKKRLIQLMNSNNMHMNFNQPTRITKSSATCIDNVFTNFETHSSQIIEPGLSDHTAQIVHFSIPVIKSEIKSIIYSRKFHKHNIDTFNNLLNNQDWSPVLADPKHHRSDLDIVNANYNTFSNIFFSCFEEAFPKTSNKKNGNNNEYHKKWITKGIIKSCETKKLLFIKMKKHNDETSKKAYNDYKKCLSLVIKEAKKQANDKYIHNHVNKAKAAWTVINNEIGRMKSKTDIDMLELNGIEIKDPDKIASTFNTFFNTIADELLKSQNNNNSTNILHNQIPELNSINTPHIFDTFHPTTEREIMSVVSSLKNSYSYGWDELSTNLLKQCISSISNPLTYVINQSLRYGIFPEKLKFGIIKPLFKKGDAKEVSNYRPIALLSAFSKIFEKVVYLRLIKYLETNKILNASQYGFRKEKNITHAIFDLIQSVLQALDSSNRVAGIYCDLSKAFDCVNHLRLLDKLRSYGIKGETLHWFKSYLTTRHQKVMIEHSSNIKAESSWLETKHGVPQGSILGPILFLIYINDLPLSIIDSQVILFADDTTLISKAESNELLSEKLKENTITINQWLHMNNLTMNVAKTHLLQFNCRHKPKENKCMIDIPPVKIEPVNSTKFLGIILDETLSWNGHIKTLSKTLCKACFALKTLLATVNQQIIITAYHALFSSYLRYGIIFWGNASDSIIIFRLQKRAIRIISNIPFNASCRPHFKRLEILPLPCLYIYSILIFLNLNQSMFDKHQHTHHHTTRNVKSKTYQYPIHRTTLLEKGPFYSAIKLYNNLPNSIKESVNFKKSLKDYLLENCFYTIDEYMSTK